jgi:hypothetical protein
VGGQVWGRQPQGWVHLLVSVLLAMAISTPHCACSDSNLFIARPNIWDDPSAIFAYCFTCSEVLYLLQPRCTDVRADSFAVSFYFVV